MDKRHRPAKKRYRSQGETPFATTSLILTTDLVKAIEKKLEECPQYHANMSMFIEENIDTSLITETKGRRLYKKEETAKKTCTFTRGFFEKLKKSGNMSLTVETLLAGVFHSPN